LAYANNSLLITLNLLGNEQLCLAASIRGFKYEVQRLT
jgi:hypothetical protein